MTGRRRARLLVATALAAACMVGCGAEAERDEVLRAPSPDGALDAVVVRTGSDATSGYGFQLFLPARGGAAGSVPVLRVVDATVDGHAWGVTLRWTGARELDVGYLRARFADPEGTVVASTPAGTVTVVPRPTAREGVETDPAPERVAAALGFAALAPLPPGARVPRLETQDGIDTRVALVVAGDAGGITDWLARSGFPSAPATGDLPQQRVANPDGAVVYRDAAVTAPAPGAVVVEVTAFTT